MNNTNKARLSISRHSKIQESEIRSFLLLKSQEGQANSQNNENCLKGSKCIQKDRPTSKNKESLNKRNSVKEKSTKQPLNHNIRLLNNPLDQPSKFHPQNLGCNFSALSTSLIYDQNAVELLTFITGGYEDDDAAVSHMENGFQPILLYHHFETAIRNFKVFNSIYQSAVTEYRRGRVKEQHIKQGSLMAVVYLKENMSKMTSSKLEAFLKRHYIML